MLERPELLVEEGIQAGLSASLAPGSSFVGSDLSSAVIIADPALLPSHFELVFEDGKTALRAVAGEVVLNDGTWLAPGENIVCSETCSFTAGNTRFALRVPEQALATTSIGAGAATRQATGAKSGKNAISVASGMVAITAVGLLIFTAAGLRSGKATPATAGHNVHVAAPATPRMVSIDEVMQNLRTRLDAAGLSALASAPARDGSVIVQGSLFPAQMSAWVGVREWYDMQYGNGRVLVDQVIPAGAGPSMVISAVWAGATPYVIDDHGDKLFVGASVGGGWTIQAIQPGHVIVQNGQQKVAVRY
jgi:hypothetical protein